MASQNTLRLNPKKLLRSKWTAAQPRNKEKHFIVTKLVEPETPLQTIENIELEALHSRRVLVLPWLELSDRSKWLQGWQ
jgi:tryptophan-rich hypothetical protein